jgi:hypothetical protein
MGVVVLCMLCCVLLATIIFYFSTDKAIQIKTI